MIELTADNFAQVTSKDFAFIVFYAPWCKHCQILKPVFQELAKQMINTDRLIFAIVFLLDQIFLFNSLFSSRWIVPVKVVFAQNIVFEVIQH